MRVIIPSCFLDVFHVKDGIGISYLRLPMGASDYVNGPYYTYDEMKEPYEGIRLDNFSIGKDMKYIIPVLIDAIKEANNGERINVMASPWTAPLWMKTNYTFKGCSDQNAIDNNCDEQYRVKLNPKYYDAYAQYFVKFIQAYKNNGIAIDAVTIQNEPHQATIYYPGMYMEWNEQADFIVHLRKAFEENETARNTKILIWDHNWDQWEYPIKLMNELNKLDAINYINGSAWHGYQDKCNYCFNKSDCYCFAYYYQGASTQSSVNDLYPNMDIYFTEFSPSGDSNPGKFGEKITWNCHNIFIPAIRNWAKTVMLWNTALNETHGPYNNTDPKKPTSRGLINFTKNVDKYGLEPEYWVLGHFSKFVDPGAVRIESTTINNELETVAFKNKTDKSIVLVALNPSDTNKSLFSVRWKNNYFNFELDPQSIVTFKWNGEMS